MGREIGNATPEELVSAARAMYENAKRDRIDPNSARWTAIIHPFQKDIRVRILLGDPESIRLKYALLYMHRLNRMLRLRKKKGIEFRTEQGLAKKMRTIARTGRWQGKEATDLDMAGIDSVTIFQG